MQIVTVGGQTSLISQSRLELQETRRPSDPGATATAWTCTRLTTVWGWAGKDLNSASNRSRHAISKWTTQTRQKSNYAQGKFSAFYFIKSQPSQLLPNLIQVTTGLAETVQSTTVLPETTVSADFRGLTIFTTKPVVTCRFFFGLSKSYPDVKAKYDQNTLM